MTVLEIQSAIEKLSPAEIAELGAWFEERQNLINASAQIFAIYDKEESEGREST